nr:hypothetical protein [uncultured Cohaesibacter sp.]
MRSVPRSVTHPGPKAAERLPFSRSRGRAVTLALRGDQDLQSAIAEALAGVGLYSGWLELEAAPVDALAYVIPDKAPNDQTVAWYSQTHRLQAPGLIHHLGLVVGQADGALFLHGHGSWGHGSWSETDGAVRFGHVLFAETMLAQDVIAHGFLLDDACFERLPDAESNFSLFQTKSLSQPEPDGADFALLRMLPNEDLAMGLDMVCARLGWQQARVFGLGSLVGAEFDDGRLLDSFATEFVIRDALAHGEAGCLRGPEIVIVGEAGGAGLRGRVTRGANPVLVTAEILLQRIS